MKEKILKRVLTFVISIVLVLIFAKPFDLNLVATDYYVLEDIGMVQYANNWFGPNGRMIGYVYLHLLDFLGLSINTYIISMKIIAVIVASLSITMLYYLFNDLVKNLMNSKFIFRNNFILFVLSSLVILNPGSSDYFFFPESGIMCISIFLVIASCRIFFDIDSWKKYIILALLLFLSTICYQASILLYMPLCIFILYIKYLENDENRSNFLHSSWKTIFLNIFITILALLLNLILVYCCKNIFETNFYLFNSISISKYSIFIITLYVLFLTKELIPTIYFTIIYISLIIFGLMKFRRKEKENRSLALVLLMIFLGTIFEAASILYMTSSYSVFRIYYAYFAILPINMLLCFINNSINSKKATIMVCVVICIIVSMIATNRISLYLSDISRKNDYEIVMHIKDKINLWNKNSDIKIKKIKYCLDSSHQFLYFDNLFNQGNKTYRLLGPKHCTMPYLKCMLGESIIIDLDQSAFEEVFHSMEYSDFNDNQLIIKGDTLYYLIY